MTQSEAMTAQEQAREWLPHLCPTCEAVKIIRSLLASLEEVQRERDKAVRSLESSGFTDCGAELWKPPVKNTEFIQTLLADAECMAEEVLNAHRLDSEGYLQHGHTCPACTTARKYTNKGETK